MGVMTLFLIAAELAVASPPNAPQCMQITTTDGLWGADRVPELCNPDGGCEALDPTIAVVDGCFAVPPPPEQWRVVAEQVLTNGFRRRIRHVKECSPEVIQSWVFVDGVLRQSNAAQRTCGKSPSSPRPLRLVVRSKPPDSQRALDHLQASNPLIAEAARQAAILAQSVPAVCSRIATEIATADRDSAKKWFAAAHATCLVAPIAERFLSEGWEEADTALVRLVEDPAERFRLLLGATRAGHRAPALAASIPRPLSTSQMTRLIDAGKTPRGLRSGLAKDSLGEELMRKCHREAAATESALAHLAAAEAQEAAAPLWTDVISELPRFAAACVVENVHVQRVLASRPESEFLALANAASSGEPPNVDPSIKRAFRRALVLRLDATRTLSAAAWTFLVDELGDDPKVLSGIQRALSCDAARAPVRVSNPIGAAFIEQGVDLSCAEPEVVGDFVAVDPTDFDVFDDDARLAPRPGPNRASTAPSTTDPSDSMAAAQANKPVDANGDTAGAASTAMEPAGVEPTTVRARLFSEGLSIAPLLGATAFFQGPMVGGGLLGHWHLSERFSLTAMANAAFSCTLCIDGTTGTRTDLRLDVGVEALALPHLDISPYTRLAVALAHIEVVEIRRAAFHDAIGPELTVGIDWLPVDGARIFVETGAFWLFEFARNVRPGGQIAPSPRGVAPVDGSTFGVSARIGLALKL